MRTISAASLEKLSQKTGTEPICLVEVEWEIGSRKIYGDKSVGSTEIGGRIIQITAFDEILNVSKSSTSQTVTVTLDDTDGQMKDLFNNVDLHKKRVWVWQWFTGIPIEDKFLLFAGVIASPISWKESDRTLTFSVISKSSDIEVGFSPEEGQFSNLPQSQVGKVWPLVFGQVMKLPAIRIDEIPYKDKQGDAADSTTQDDHGIEDPSLDPHIRGQDDQAAYAGALAQLYMIGYLQASFTARKLGELGDLDPISSGSGYYSGLATQYLALANKFLLEGQKIKTKNEKLRGTLQTQRAYNKNQISVTNGSLFKQGVVKKYRISEGLYTGSFVGNAFNILSAQHPRQERYDELEHPPADVETEPQIYEARNEFFWNPSGARLMQAILPGEGDDSPDYIRYIVAATLPVSIRVVYAFRDHSGVRQLSVVPSNFYEIVQTQWGTLPTTMIVVKDPLSSLTDGNGRSLGWDDDLWVTCTSPIGPNTGEIIRFLIQNYTNHSIDEASFGSVIALLAKYPSNFAVLDRPNVISLIQDIAYQARCVVWLKNNVFHIRYLSIKTAPSAVLTEADILEQSLEVSYTETEDLTTKVKASWKSDYKHSSPNLVILRYNIKYYGLHEKDQNYFIYNQQFLVEKSAVFWLIRDSNTFKRVTCKVPIKFLNIETLDTVTLNFNHNFIANGPIDCVVEAAQLDTSDYTITLTLWVPIRAGEMEEYLFAFPASLDIQYFWPTEKDVSSGRAGSGGDVASNNNVREPSTGRSEIDKPMSGDDGNGGSIHTSRRPLTWGVDPEQFSDSGNSTPDIITRIDETRLNGSFASKPTGTKTYQLNKSRVQDKPISTILIPGAFPAKVVSGGPGKGPYALKVYLQGIGNQAASVDGAKQLQIFDTDTVPADTWVIATRVVYEKPKQGGKKDEKETFVEWYFQVPVWV